jgi:hypothetical protein
VRTQRRKFAAGDLRRQRRFRLQFPIGQFSSISGVRFYGFTARDPGSYYSASSKAASTVRIPAKTIHHLSVLQRTPLGFLAATIARFRAKSRKFNYFRGIPKFLQSAPYSVAKGTFSC